MTIIKRCMFKDTDIHRPRSSQRPKMVRLKWTVHDTNVLPFKKDDGNILIDKER